jgi:hypothetical protein
MARFDGSTRRDDHVRLAALQQREKLGSKRLVEPDLDVRAMLRVSGQEGGEHAVDGLRCRCHLEQAAIRTPQELRPVLDGGQRAESIAAFRQQHLAVAGQNQPAPDTIEQRDAEIGFEILDLAGQRRLRDAELCRRFRNRAEIRDGHERA